MSIFGDRLRFLRIKNCMLVKDVAIRVGVQSAAITNWERGIRFPKDCYILKVADIFNVSTDFLLGREDFDGAVNDNASRLDIDVKLKGLIKDVEGVDKVTFNGKVLGDGDVNFIINYLNNVLEVYDLHIKE
ncbi:MAG: helix-turn-helix domain-containing protein [Clostridium sp.]